MPNSTQTTPFERDIARLLPLTQAALAQGPVPLRHLTVEVIWAGLGTPATHEPALVDLALRELDRRGTVSIADDGLVTWTGA